MFVARFVAGMAVLAAAALCATLPADAKTLRWASQGDALTLDPHNPGKKRDRFPRNCSRAISGNYDSRQIEWIRGCYGNHILAT